MSTILPTISTTASKRHQRGFGMIEVLVALVLIAVGVAGLARFQGVFLRDGSGAKARAIAAQLAREKLDDLKSFSQLATGVAGTFGFAEIGNNTGGAEANDGSLRLPSGAVTVANTDYQRTWTASPRYFCANNAAPTLANCAGAAAKVRADFLALKVTITWTDQDNIAQTLTLDDVVASIDPASVATALISGVSAQPPSVPYTPGAAPSVLAIDIGGSQKKETTNPTPTLNKSGQTIINTIARYATIRYSATSKTITREEFATLNCLCTQQGSGQGYNMAGVLVAKRIGAPANSSQVAECATCCRDHHDDLACDPSTSTGKNGCYDPFRPTSDYSSGDHNHYNANGGLANTTGATYQEACRLKRVDGVLRVAQDWHLASLSLIPESFFAVSGSVNTSNVTSYSNYVKNYVAAYLSNGTLPTKPWTLASNVAKDATKNFVSRGLYIDYMDTTKSAAYSARISAGDANVFQEIPFYEVNMSKLAQWNSADSNIVTVRNDQLLTEQAGQNLYTRGLATGKNFGVADINSFTTAGNTGVINEFITTDPNDGAVVVSDLHEITVPGANPTVSGTISPTVASGLTVSASNGGSCTQSSGIYSCSVPFNWDGDVTPLASGFVFTPATRSYTGLIANSTGQNFTSAVSSTQYSISGTITPALGAVNFTVSSGGSCTYNSGAGTYSCTVPEHWVGSITPSASGYSFAPGQYSYSDVTANQTAQNFAASVVVSSFTISGTIAPAPASVSFAISAGGSCSYTSGAYSCTVPSGWTGSITPSASSTIFTPSSRSYTAVSSDQASQNYSTAPSSYIISGLVAPNAAGSSFTANNGGGPCTYTAGSPNGSYSCTVPSLWSGSITPAASGKTFSPASRAYTNVTSNQVTENYSSADVASSTITISGSITGLSKGTPTIAATAGASCTIQSRTAQCTSSCTYSCTVTISGGVGWNGTITPGNTSAARESFTPADKTYSGITSNQTQNFSCSGSGC